MLKRFFLPLVTFVVLAMPRLSAQPGDPCDPVFVADLQNQLIAEGFDCLQGAGPFACIDEVFNFALENCPPPIDTTNWGNPCDPAMVADLQNQLIAEGFDCLAGAGPFTCVDEVLDYAFTNCPLPVDTSYVGPCNPCDSLVVANLQDQLIDQGFDCLQGAGPFACVDEVFDYAFDNCPPPIDTTGWGNPCDPAIVADLQNQLIAEGFDCLNGAGPFACVNDVFDYAFANCPTPIDTTGWGNPCDPAIVADLQNQLIAEGFNCLQGAGPFDCVDDVFNYAFDNCPPPVDSSDCDPAAVAALQAQLIDEGYDCLVGAGPFACEHDVLCYAMNTCPPDVDTFFIDLPDCLLNIPADVVTFQQFLQYIVANCDSSVTAGISPCWLAAPAFDTDQEFFEWLAENCPDDFHFLAANGQPVFSAFNEARTTSTPALSGKNALRLKISPNPASAVFEARLDGNQSISRLELSDFSGKILAAKSGLGTNRVSVPVSELPQGVYLVRVFAENGAVSTQKLVKQ